MKLVSIYKCLCDETRLRIVHLLSVSPLCVCHLQEVLGKSQVIISQHLAYLRERDIVSGQRYQHWMIYSLPARLSPELKANLECLQACSDVDPTLRKDRAALDKLMGNRSARALLEEGCCAIPKGKLKVARRDSKRTKQTV